jgi:hypothetical protein
MQNVTDAPIAAEVFDDEQLHTFPSLKMIMKMCDAMRQWPLWQQVTVTMMINFIQFSRLKMDLFCYG